MKKSTLNKLEKRKFYIYALPDVVLIAAGLIGYKAAGWNAVPELPEPSLKALALEKGLRIGNFAIPSRLDEKPYSEILTKQFEFAIIDNQPNWHFTDYSLRPSREDFDFSRIDEVMDFAEKNGMPVQIHHYLWGEEKWLPDWLKNGNYSKTELEEIIKHHIMTVGGRYQGRVKEWTVVNEAFSRNMHIYGLRDWWGDAMGDMSYIDLAFKTAREADPQSALILNDFSNEGINDVSNAMYDYVKSAKARGIPIDGIGMQMHIDGTHPPTKDEVISNMNRFGQLGVNVYVTEFDVNMNDVQADAKTKNDMEGKIYYEMLRACLESQYCRSFGILGITDKETWYNYMGLTDARPLPFDEDYQPKPAYYSMRQALIDP